MKKSVRLAATMLAAAALGACGTTNSTTSTSQPFKAAWIYVGTAGDHGWTQAHDDGRKLVEQQLGTAVKTTFKENVPEGPQVEQVVEDLVRDGNKIIFATSFGFQDAMANEAAKHPDVRFEQATGFKTANNLAEYFGAAEDADYLTVALGAQTTHPGATVQVVWTNTWFDPTKEKQAAQSLLSRGVDAIGQGQDSPATGEAAKAVGVKWSGYDSDQSNVAPDIWLTGTVYHWGPYYVRRVKAAMDGSWKTGSYYGSIGDGMIDIAPFGQSVTQAVRDQINAKKEALKNGTFYEFTGPLKDQTGAVKIAAGTKMTLEQILSMDWFVQGVIGSPKGG